MPRLKITALIFTALGASMPMFTQTAPTQGTASTTQAIAIVSFNNAVLGTAEAQRDLGVLQKKYSPREEGLQKLNGDIETARKALGDPSSRLTDAEKSQRMLDLNNKEKQLQRQAEDFKNDSQSDSQQIFQRVAQKVYVFLQEYAQQHLYAAVLDRGSEASPVVWYAANNIDITEQVVKAYDQKTGIITTALPDKPASVRPSEIPKKRP